MTFRRLKKVNSSGPSSHAGPAACQDIYFPSSKSDSCRTADVPGNSSEVYNYRTLAYSGGTLPRSYTKVGSQHTTFVWLLKSLHVYFVLMFGAFTSWQTPTAESFQPLFWSFWASNDFYFGGQLNTLCLTFGCVFVLTQHLHLKVSVSVLCDAA